MAKENSKRWKHQNRNIIQDTKSMKNIIFLFLLLVLSISCTNNANEPIHNAKILNDPIELIDGFKSYQPIETVKQYCDSLGYPWEVIEDSKLSPGDKRPRFDIFVVEINNFKHLDQTGNLKLEFFNNRLSSISFYPVDEIAYLRELSDKKNINLIDINKITKDNLKIWKYRNYKDKFYIGWQDLRLEQEEWEWIKKYS